MIFCFDRSRVTKRNLLFSLTSAAVGGAIGMSPSQYALAQTVSLEHLTRCPQNGSIEIEFKLIIDSLFNSTQAPVLSGYTMPLFGKLVASSSDPRNYIAIYTPRADYFGPDEFSIYVQSTAGRSEINVVIDVFQQDVEIPAPRRIIKVNSASALRSALGGSLQGGDRIVLAGTPQSQVTYAGDFTLARGGQEPSDSDRIGAPIVVQAANPLGARFTGKFDLSGANVWLHGLDFDGQNANGAIRVSMDGDHTRLMRCRFRRHRTAADQGGGAIIVMLAAKYNKVWYCEFTDFDGRAISSKTTDSPALYPHIYRCYWHDNVAPPATSDGNGRECLQLGQTQGDGTPVRTPMYGLVEYNLLKDLYLGPGHDESEPVSNKSSNNIFRYNTFDNLKNYLTIRFGVRCQVIANHFTNSGGIVVYGDRHRIIGNVITGTVNPRRIRVFSGTQTMELDPGYVHPNGPTTPDAGNMVGFTPWGGKADPDKSDEPVARDTFLSGNSGTLLIGEMPREYARLRCTGTVVEDHKGNILTERMYATWGGRAHSSKGSAFASDGHREYGTVYRASASVTVPTASPLSIEQVGPAAPWVQPSAWPPTLT